MNVPFYACNLAQFDQQGLELVFVRQEVAVAVAFAHDAVARLAESLERA
ncbi:MAG: hypothetical protein WHT28_08835 [Fimbriimonadales bacterium]